MDRKYGLTPLTKDVIEFIYHPGQDRSVTIEGLKECKVYSRRYRNIRIGVFLKKLHLSGGHNTGFKKIIDALRSNNMNKKSLLTVPYGTKVK